MTTIYNFYYCSENKNSNETNSDFNIILDENLIIDENDKVFLKINNISFLNNLLNISQHHLNDYFEVEYNSVITRYYLTDGNYSIYTFKDKINELLTSYNFSMTYDTILCKYYYRLSSGTININPCNLGKFFGLNSIKVIDTNIVYSDDVVDFRSYNKLLLTSSLTFVNNPWNNLISSFTSNSGIGSICCWLDRSDIPFKTITYNNSEENEIANKNIKNINFKILNEYREIISNMPDIQLQFQIIIKDGYNYNRKIVKLLNHMVDMLKTIYNYIYYVKLFG
jgi:hypothetical protein